MSQLPLDKLEVYMPVAGALEALEDDEDIVHHRDHTDWFPEPQYRTAVLALRALRDQIAGGGDYYTSPEDLDAARREAAEDAYADHPFNVDYDGVPGVWAADLGWETSGDTWSRKVFVQPLTDDDADTFVVVFAVDFEKGGARVLDVLSYKP